MMKTNRLRKQISLKTSLLVFAVGLVCAGWSAFRHSSYVSASTPADVARSETTLPSQFFALSPEANALIEAKVKGEERTFKASKLPRRQSIHR
jgi:hypothetical protein